MTKKSKVKSSDLPKDLLRPARFGPSLGRPATGAFPQVDRVKLARRLGWSTQALGRLLRGEVGLDAVRIEAVARHLGLASHQVTAAILRSIERSTRSERR